MERENICKNLISIVKHKDARTGVMWSCFLVLVKSLAAEFCGVRSRSIDFGVREVK